MLIRATRKLRINALLLGLGVLLVTLGFNVLLSVSTLNTLATDMVLSGYRSGAERLGRDIERGMRFGKPLPSFAGMEEMLAELGGTTPAMMISNLPYNVGTPLLVAWLKSGPWRGEMALMFQKEVAERVCAKPNTDQYGRLAVLTHAVTDPHIAFTLPPGAFRPPPKVDSAVAVLHPLPPEKVFPHLDKLEEVAGAAFGQRRKMLRAGLKPLAKRHGLKAVEWLQSLDIDPTARAETLSQDEFRRMAASLVK